MNKWLRQLPHSGSLGIFLITFLVHCIAAALLQHNSATWINLSDQGSYHDAGVQISNLLRSGTYMWNAVYPHHWYPLFIGIVYRVFGSALWIGIACNALLAAGTAVLLYKSMRLISDLRRTSWYTALTIATAYPMFLYSTSMLIKESWMVFLLIVAVYATLRMLNEQSFSWRWFLVFLSSFLLVRDLRFFVGFAVLTGFFAGWFINRNITVPTRVWQGIVMLVSISTICFLLQGEGMFNSITFADYATPSYIYHVRSRYYAGGSTTTGVEVVKKTLTDNDQADTFSFSLGGFVASATTTIFGPFPKQLPSEKYHVALLDLLVWYPAGILALAGIWRERKSPLVWTIAVAGIFLISGVIVGADNIGALLRYRMPALMVLSICIPPGIALATALLRKKTI